MLTAKMVKQLSLHAGADLAGIASADRFVNAPGGHHPADILPSCRSVIVLAGILPVGTLSQDVLTYTAIRNELVKKMTAVARKVATAIRKQGYDTQAITSLGGSYEKGRLHGHISLKHAGELAGLGKIGRNYLLTNDKAGNQLWLSAVLLSASLQADALATYTVCDECGRCVTACPSKALEKPSVFAVKSCDKVCCKTIKGKLALRCWACRNVCPYRNGIENK